MSTTFGTPSISPTHAPAVATAAMTRRRPWWRPLAVGAAFVGAMAPMCAGALLGPTLVFLVPVLLPAAACLLSGTLQALDERERQAERRARETITR